MNEVGGLALAAKAGHGVIIVQVRIFANVEGKSPP
jgi:hypothetical protein